MAYLSYILLIVAKTIAFLSVLWYTGNPGDWTTIQAPIPDDFKQFGFDWNRWDTHANSVLETWPVPSDWRKK